MAQQTGGAGYAMEFPVKGFPSLTDRKWKVIITRPDGTSIERLSDDDDVAVTSTSEGLMAVRIKEGDFPSAGVYRLQVWDITDGENASLRSSVRAFDVLDSLSAPATV